MRLSGNAKKIHLLWRDGYRLRSASVVKLGAELMHRIHQHPHPLRVHARVDAMSQVEYVSGTGAKTVEHALHLNHLNLFGGGYWAQVEGLMDRLLSEVR